MSHLQHHPIAQISGRIYGVAAYYSENDATQHVVVATHDGTLYEVHWNSSTAVTSPQWLGQFPGIASLGGFFTSDDNFQHVIVATEDGRLHELYFTNPQQVNTRSPLFSLPTTAGPHIGMASFFSSNDRLRHAIVGGKDNNVVDMAAYYSDYDRTNHVILATVDGNIHEIYYA